MDATPKLPACSNLFCSKETLRGAHVRGLPRASMWRLIRDSTLRPLATDDWPPFNTTKESKHFLPYSDTFMSSLPKRGKNPVFVTMPQPFRWH